MSWPILFAQTPAAPGTPPAPPAPPAAPATPAAPVEVPAAPATPAAPTDVPATPAAPTDIPTSVPADALNTPANPVTEMTPGVAQTPTSQEVEYESIHTNGLGGLQWVVLVIFAGVCVGLITCVLFTTSKSDLGGAIVGGGATAPFRGKKSGEEQLTQVTTWFATAFIVMSLAMAFVFRF